MRQENITPINVGQQLSVIPEGVGKQGDVFFNIGGFVVFVKRVPEQKRAELIKVRVVSIKSNCGIAVFEE